MTDIAPPAPRSDYLHDGSTQAHRHPGHPIDHVLLFLRRSGSYGSNCCGQTAVSFPTIDTYNKQFTFHGIVMVWFFLVPSIPTTLGIFLLPLMIGAKDLAFPGSISSRGISISAARGLRSSP